MSRQGVAHPMLEEATVLDTDTGRPVPADGRTLGELVVRGNTVMKGYLHNPEATRAALADGWLHTGDLAVLHPDGYVEIKDRAKDIIISGGENISSLEIEEVLYQHPRWSRPRWWRARIRAGARHPRVRRLAGGCLTQNHG